MLNGRKIRVLYAGDMEFARAQFASEAPQLHLVAVDDALAANAPPGANESPEIAFIDCGAPGINAARLLEQLRARPVAIPTVLALDSSVENCERVAVDLQADDYTIKTPGWLGRLTTRLAMVVARHEHAQGFQAVRTREERLRRIVESAPVCLGRVRADGTIVAVNDAARAMLGVTKSEDVLRKPIFAFVSAEDAEPLRKFLAGVCGGRPGSLEIMTAGPYGSPRAVEAKGVTLAPDASGEPSVLLTLRDISERKRLESSVVENVRAGADQSGTRVRVLELESKVAGLERKLAEAETQRTAAAAARDAAATTCESLRNEQQNLLATIDTMKQSAGAAQAEEAAALRQQLADQQQAQRAMAGTLAALEAQHAQTVNAHEQSLAAYQEALAARAVVEGALADAQARLASESAGERAGQEALEAARAALDAELRAGQRILAATEEQLFELRAGQAAAHADQAGLRQALADATTARDAAETKRAALDAELRVCQQALAAAEHLLGELRAGQAAVQADQAGLRQALADATASRDAAEANRAAVAAERDAAVAARDQAVAARDQAVALRDQATALRDRAFADRDLGAAAREHALAARNEATAARDEAVAARQSLADRLRALEVDQVAAIEARLAAEQALASAEAQHAAEMAAGRAAREVLDTHLKRVEQERSRLAQASLLRTEDSQGAASAEVAACRTTITSLEVQLSEREREYANAVADRDRLRHELQTAAAAAPDVHLARAAFNQALNLASPAPAELTNQKALAERLEAAEAACRRAEAERDEVVDQRGLQAEELTRARKQAADFERLATERLDTCAALERSLQALRDELDDLSEWARIRSLRAGEALTLR